MKFLTLLPTIERFVAKLNFLSHDSEGCLSVYAQTLHFCRFSSSVLTGEVRLAHFGHVPSMARVTDDLAMTILSSSCLYCASEASSLASKASLLLGKGKELTQFSVSRSSDLQKKQLFKDTLLWNAITYGMQVLNFMSFEGDALGYVTPKLLSLEFTSNFKKFESSFIFSQFLLLSGSCFDSSAGPTWRAAFVLLRMQQHLLRLSADIRTFETLHVH